MYIHIYFDKSILKSKIKRLEYSKKKKRGGGENLCFVLANQKKYFNKKKVFTKKRGNLMH